MPDTQDVISLDQQRAAYAWICSDVAYEVLQATPDGFGKYVSLVKSAPALTMNNGLMQFLAFCRSKLDDQKPKKELRYRLLLMFVLFWLADNGKAPAIIRGLTGNGIPLGTQRELYERMMKLLHGNPASDYRAKTMETLELLKWLKQQADARKTL